VGFPVLSVLDMLLFHFLPSSANGSGVASPRIRAKRSYPSGQL